MNHAESLTVSAHGEREIVIMRRFDAACADVFDAMTRAELLRSWLTGPPSWSVTECESDLCVGGRYRMEWQGADDAQMAMSGAYQEVAPPLRLVRTQTFEFGCEPQAGQQLETLVLTPVDDGAATELRLTVQYPSKEARDGALASGMEQGVAESYAGLDRALDEAK